MKSWMQEVAVVTFWPPAGVGARWSALKSFNSANKAKSVLITLLSFIPPLTLSHQLPDVLGAEQNKGGGNVGSNYMSSTAWFIDF